MPVWHEASRRWVEQGKVVLLGLTQEQHPDRCRLFAQWQGFEWPILHDPINVMRSTAVPIVIAIDEHGIVRSTRPNVRTFEKEFLDRDFPKPEKPAPTSEKPDVVRLKATAEREDAARAWRDYGDALAIWRPAETGEAIKAYRKAVELAPKDPHAKFRLGVVYRMRHESESRVPGDFNRAVDNWSAALDIDPNQYIWRRRIQQYGPRLIKPYPFYDWVERAQAEVRERGETPVELKTPPSGAEIASPSRKFVAGTEEEKNPDAKGRINRDAGGLVAAAVTVVPPRIKAGESARVHFLLRPSALKQTHWTNDAGPTQVWLDVPEGWEVGRRLMTAPTPGGEETTEPRQMEVEVRAPKDAKGKVTLRGYALYYVCEDRGGTCQFLRQDLEAVVDLGGR